MEVKMSKLEALLEVRTGVDRNKRPLCKIVRKPVHLQI